MLLCNIIVWFGHNICLAGIRAKETRSPRRPSLLWPHGAHLSGWAHARADQTEGELFENFSLGQWFTILYGNVQFWLASLFQVGGVDPKQLAVYEEFARNVPGFLPSNDLSQPTGFLAQPMKVQTHPWSGCIWLSHWLRSSKVLFSALQQQAWPTDDVAHIYDKCISDLEQHLHAIPPALAMNPQTQAIRSLLEAVVMARNSRDGIAALGLLQKVRQFLGEKLSYNFWRCCQILLLEGPWFAEFSFNPNTFWSSGSPEMSKQMFWSQTLQGHWPYRCKTGHPCNTISA